MLPWIRRTAVPVLLVAGLLWGLMPPPAASGQAAQTATPTLSASATTSATPTAGVSASASATSTPSSSATATASPSASGTPTGTGTPAASATATSARATTPTVVATPTFAVTVTPTGIASGTISTPVTHGISQLTSRYSGPSAGLGMMRPRSVTTNLPTSFASITAGGSHTCALTAAGAAWCWGANNNGQLGDGTTLGSTVPVAVTGGNTFASISAGAGFTCGLTADGTAYCWGYNGNGQLGTGTTASTGIPTAVSGSLKFAGVTSGGGHACGWTVAKVAYCWGSNGSGQVGVNADPSNPMPGMNSNVTSPQAVQGQASFTSVSAGESHTCGVTATGTAYCWGSNWSGQLGDGTSGTTRTSPAVVSGLLAFQNVTAGGMHSCGIVESGQAYCWGNNSSGNLGDNTTTARNTPAAVFDTGTYAKLSLGYGHSCGIKLNGSLWCWGENYGGQIGDGTTAIATSPVLVTGIPSSISLALGVSHTCSLDPNGRATCWGKNDSGQVGDGLGGVRPTPVKVSGTATFTSVIAGGWHTCGQTAAGVTSCWGWNAKGQVGDGTTIDRAAPVTVGSTKQFAKVSPGLYHTCGLSSSGAAYCWGSGEFGGLGDSRYGTGIMASTPVAVTGGQTFTTISSGYESACAADPSSGIWCWGATGNQAWQPNSSNSVTSPQHTMISGSKVAVASGSGTARVRYCTLNGGTISCSGLEPQTVIPTVSLASIVAGGNHFCGLTEANDAWCWGSNDYGQLGDGTTSTTYGAMSGPTQVTGGLKFASMAAGGSFTCGLTSDGTAYCWGSNNYRALGNGGNAYYKLGPFPVATSLRFKLITAGAEHVCGTATDSATYCWGNAYHGQVGDGTVGYRTVPTMVVGQIAASPTPTPLPLPNRLSALATGQGHTCGLTATGSAYCWGWNAFGQVGDGTRGSDRAKPVSVAGGLTFTAIGTGGFHTCGLTKAGAAYCWGSPSDGQLGEGTVNQASAGQSSPVAVSGGRTFSSLALGRAHTCALTVTGEAWCWGDNTAGQLGDGSITDRSLPVAVSGGRIFRSIVADGSRTCALTTAGVAFCWGSNNVGQLGDGTTTDRSLPTAVTGSVDFISLAAGTGHTCGLTASGKAHCWGLNNTSPVAVAGDLSFTQLAAGNGHTCGVMVSGTGSCWGANGHGQIGDGTSGVDGNSSADRPTPVGVSGGLSFSLLVANYYHTCGITTNGVAYCWGGNRVSEVGDGTTGTDRVVPTLVDVSDIPVTTTIRAIRVANVRDSSFTVSWVTDVASTGTVGWRLGTSTASPTFAVDVRGADTSSTVHQVTVTGLAASTRYLFEVTSGATTETNGGTHFAVTTGPILSIPATDSVYGTVVRKDGTTPSAVTIHLTASGSAGTSAPLATLVRTTDAKAWILGLGNLRTADASAAFTYTDATVLTVQADGGADGTAVGTVTVADARIGKLALTLSDEISTPLQTGWNLVALQVTPASPVTAMALCSSLDATVAGSAYEIDRWENSGWEGHRCGVPANNFTLEPGRGYFIRVTKPVTWSVGGTRIITPPSLSLGTGWNLVGVGAVAPGTVSAPSGCTAMDGTAGTGTVVELDRWEAGAWEGHRCGLPVNAFTLQAGRGYFVRLTRPAIWAPSGGAP